MDLPHSNGFASYVDNVGEVKNNGWEASASVYVIRNAERDINWIIGGQLTYNKNYVSKLSEAIKAQNEAYLKEDVDVANLFYEGRPQNGIYVVRSLGIDPANGQEIFLDKDGNRTDIWKASDKVYVGQADPRYRGYCQYDVYVERIDGKCIGFLLLGWEEVQFDDYRPGRSRAYHLDGTECGCPGSVRPLAETGGYRSIQEIRR